MGLGYRGVRVKEALRRASTEDDNNGSEKPKKQPNDVLWLLTVVDNTWRTYITVAYLWPLIEVN